MRRLVPLATWLAPRIGADPVQAAKAARLAKADLVTGMVGEFPELQGVMGGYYARNDREPDAVADAVRDHYAPRGLTDLVPNAPVTVTVAIADKLDQLQQFFSKDLGPTGSGDPFGLRRAALGLIRLVRGNGLRIPLKAAMIDVGLDALAQTDEQFRSQGLGEYPPGKRERERLPQIAENVLEFLLDRLRVQLRAEGARHDVLAAVFAAGADDDLVRLLARTDALAALLGTENGANLLTAYRRAANILRIEEKRDGPHRDPPDPALFAQTEEHALAAALDELEPRLTALLHEEDFTGAMATLAALRPPLDAFFDHVTVNAPEPALRRNRLSLLNRVRAAMDQVADFSKIEG